MKTLHVRIEGKVQGVFFRDFTRREAQKRGIKGWVKNRSDGSVETLIQGDPDEVRKMKEWFYTGSPHSSVTAVNSSEISETKEYADFSIRY